MLILVGITLFTKIASIIGSIGNSNTVPLFNNTDDLAAPPSPPPVNKVLLNPNNVLIKSFGLMASVALVPFKRDDIFKVKFPPLIVTF